MTVRGGGLIGCVLLLMLSACGGGGGDGGAGGSGAGTAIATSSASDGNWLTFDPAAPGVTQFEGESVAFTVKATSTRTFTAPFNLAIIDAAGVITTQVQVAATSQTAYSAVLHTNASLSAGAHSSALEVRVCEDAPQTCAKPFPGSPWRLPLTVQVKAKAEAAARLTLSLPSVDVTTYPGESVSFTIEAQLNPELAARVVNIGWVDPASLTTVPAGQLTLAADGHYVFKLATATANNLAVGAYTSKLQLRLCADDVRTCLQPVAGSPWIVPLTVTVKSPSNLSALKAIDGLGAWSTYQGNAGHTGFVGASFDPAAFSRRWRVASVATTRLDLASAAIDGERAFFVRKTALGRWELVAVSEDTGALAWKVNIDVDDIAAVNPPAAANGRVYLTSTSSPKSYLWIYDQATGAKINQLLMSSQWASYSAPTVYGTEVYSINGYYGGIGNYSELTGKFRWTTALSGEEGYSPSTDGKFVYSYSMPDNRFIALNAADGSSAYTIGSPYPYSTWFTTAPVIMTDTQQAIVAAGNLMAFDLASHTRAWVLGTGASGVPAYGNGTVYVFAADGRTLEAHAAATGALLWTSSDLAGGNFSNVVVTRNLAFVSSTASTLAVDLDTRKVVWSYPQGGTLALSRRGVLYILSNVGALSAVNLR